MELTEVWEHYERATESLAVAYDEVRRCGSGSGSFWGMTPAELSDAFAALRVELDHQTNMMLAASVERTLQLDLAARASRRNKELWRRFRALRDGAPSGRPTAEDLLDLWRELSGKVKLIGQYKQFLKHRHWLAHGRYWTCKCGYHGIDPAVARDLATGVLMLPTP